MHHLTVNSLFLGSLTNAIAVDAKLLVSVFAGAIGIAAAVTRNISEIREDRSKRATEEVETARVAALVDVLVKLPQDDSSAACKKELELQLDHCVSKLSAARTKALNRARMSNRDLTFLQRVFVLFPPNSRIAWIIQGLAYLFMAGGPLAVLLLVLFRIGDSGTVSDVVVLAIFGSIAFRVWALAERRWALQSDDPAGQPLQFDATPLASLFLLRRPIGWKMLAAQVCMWTCLFCAVESFEDIFLAGVDANSAAIALQEAKTANRDSSQAEQDLPDAQKAMKEARDDAKGGLLLFLASLLGMGLCRAWASSELRHGLSPDIACSNAIFPMWRPLTAKARLLVAGQIMAIALLAASIIFGPRIFRDPIDRIELVFLGIAACVTLNRLLNSCPHRAANPLTGESASWSQSLAAQSNIGES